MYTNYIMVYTYVDGLRPTWHSHLRQMKNSLSPLAEQALQRRPAKTD